MCLFAQEEDSKEAGQHGLRQATYENGRLAADFVGKLYSAEDSPVYHGLTREMTDTMENVYVFWKDTLTKKPIWEKFELVTGDFET